MRLQLNLNQYYDGLDDYQVNYLFGLLVDLKPSIGVFKSACKANDKEFMDHEKVTIFHTFEKVDSFMESMNKESIFNTKDISEKYITDEEFFDEFDIMPLMKKYEYLMEETQ